MPKTRKMYTALKLHSGKLLAVIFFFATVGLIGTTLKLREDIAVLQTSLKNQEINIPPSKSRIKRSLERPAVEPAEPIPDGDAKSSRNRNVSNRGSVVEFSRPHGGAVYTRWGRSVCPSTDIEFIYEGTVGGAHSSHTGGASELLCLHRNPQWNGYTDTGESGQQYIYGAEFKSSVTFFKKTNAESFLHHDIVCAVCRSRTRISQIMIPARRECPPSWTKEYEGYLMTSAYTAKSKYQHICVDEAPEADAKGYESKGGAALHHVQAHCGSLPCPSYKTGRELTCVVCTK